MQAVTGVTERRFEAQTLASTESVERNREVVDAREGHGVSSFVDRNSGLVGGAAQGTRFIGAEVQTPPSTETQRISNVQPPRLDGH